MFRYQKGKRESSTSAAVLVASSLISPAFASDAIALQPDTPEMSRSAVFKDADGSVVAYTYETFGGASVSGNGGGSRISLSQVTSAATSATICCESGEPVGTAKVFGHTLDGDTRYSALATAPTADTLPAVQAMVEGQLGERHVPVVATVHHTAAAAPAAQEAARAPDSIVAATVDAFKRLVGVTKGASDVAVSAVRRDATNTDAWTAETYAKPLSIPGTSTAVPLTSTAVPLTSTAVPMAMPASLSATDSFVPVSMD